MGVRVRSGLGAWRFLEASLGVAVLAGLVTGCASGGDDDDSGADDDTSAEAGPCAGGGWGYITPGDDLVYVSPDGSDSSTDGSRATPFATLNAALAFTRDHADRKRIAVLPGTYEEELLITGEPLGGHPLGDDGLSLEGCSPDGDDVARIRSPEADWGGSLLHVSHLGTSGVRIAGVAVEGGTRAVMLAPASEDAPVEMEAVRVERACKVGISVDGHDTIVVMREVHVADTEPGTGEASGTEIGYGIAIRLARVEMYGGGVEGSTTVGIMAEGQRADVDGAGYLLLDEVVVEGTGANGDGELGRGIHVQSMMQARVTGAILRDNADAAFFALQSAEVTVQGVQVDTVAAGALSGAASTTGDGIVITSVLDPDDDFGTAGFAAGVAACTVTGVQRAAVLLEAVEAEVGAGNDFGGAAGLGGQVSYQEGAVLTGDGAAACVDLDAAGTPVELNRLVLDGGDVSGT